MKNLIPVILSGGSGTRLWPSSRKSLPKQFKEFKNIGSLFYHTLNRVNELNGCKDLIVVSAREYEFLIKKHTNRFNKESVLILEETSKNTAAAIFFAAIRALEKSDDSILCIMPSDHWIEDFKKFTTLIKKGIKHAEQHSWVTFGIKPTEPSIGFGYIKVNDNKSTGIKDVIKFIEKPDIKRAKFFLNEGNYYWNAGIFLVSAKTVLKSFDVYNLDLKKNLEKAWSNSVKSENKHIILKPYMEKIPNISIDKAIMEYQNNIKLIQFDSNWSDIGNWDSMNALLSKYDHTDNKSILIDSKNTQIQSSERVVVGIGLEDLIIVDEAHRVSPNGQGYKWILDEFKNNGKKNNRFQFVQIFFQIFLKRTIGSVSINVPLYFTPALNVAASMVSLPLTKAFNSVAVKSFKACLGMISPKPNSIASN